MACMMRGRFFGSVSRKAQDFCYSCQACRLSFFLSFFKSKNAETLKLFSLNAISLSGNSFPWEPAHQRKPLKKCQDVVSREGEGEGKMLDWLSETVGW